MLLFRAGDGEPKAVPLGLVARLEDIPRDTIEISCGQPVTQYRGQLMPLVPLSGHARPRTPRQAVLVFADVDRTLARPQHGPDGRRDRRRGRGPAAHRADRRRGPGCSAPR